MNKKPDVVSVIGLKVNVTTYESALTACLNLARRNQPGSVSAANTHIASAARNSEGFGRIMAAFDLVLPDGRVVYEPHNSWVSVFAHGGIIAGCLFIWLQLVLLYRGFTIVRFIRRNSTNGSPMFVALFFILITILIYTIGESPFTVSFFTVPYYFSAGILLKMYCDKVRHASIENMRNTGISRQESRLSPR